jgi:hypothetical protein
MKGLWSWRAGIWGSRAVFDSRSVVNGHDAVARGAQCRGCRCSVSAAFSGVLIGAAVLPPSMSSLASPSGLATPEPQILRLL